MLNSSLIAVKNKLTEHLQNRFRLQHSTVVLNPLVEQDGSVPQKNRNKMVISLVHLEQEMTQQYSGAQNRRHEQTLLKVNPPLRFNLYLLFSAAFEDYEESLKFLNATIAFFQANSVLTDLGEKSSMSGVDTLKFEIEKLSHQQIHSLYSAMGAKYQPSILYKVRYINIQSDQIKSEVPLVSEPGSGVSA